MYKYHDLGYLSGVRFFREASCNNCGDTELRILSIRVEPKRYSTTRGHRFEEAGECLTQEGEKRSNAGNQYMRPVDISTHTLPSTGVAGH